jgi:hypothetical protein
VHKARLYITHVSLSLSLSLPPSLPLSRKREPVGAHRVLLRQPAGERTTEEGRALAALALVSSDQGHLACRESWPNWANLQVERERERAKALLVTIHNGGF